MKRPDITVLPAKVWVRRIASVVLFVLSVSVMVWIFWRNAIPIGSEKFFYPDDISSNGDDFRMRMNEIECLRSGIDPFRVWSGEVIHERYFPFERKYVEDGRPGREGFRIEPIHVYTPWEYAYMFPLSCLERDAAWRVYLGLLMVAAVSLFCFGFCDGVRSHRTWTVGFLFSALATLHWLPSWYDVRFGNFGLFIAATIVGMVLSLQRGRDALAGVFYALAMTKPQACLLISIPLLLHRKYKTLFVAVAICFSGTVVSAILAGVSPVTMILEASTAGTFGFSGCALFPTVLVDYLLMAGVSKGLMVNAALIVGFVLCLWLCWKMRDETDWLWLIVPPVFLGAAWTYNQWNSYCPYAVVAVAMGHVLLSQAGRFEKMSALLIVGLSMRADVVAGRGLEYLLSVVGYELPLLAKLVLRDVLQFLVAVAFVILIVRRCARGG